MTAFGPFLLRLGGVLPARHAKLLLRLHDRAKAMAGGPIKSVLVFNLTSLAYYTTTRYYVLLLHALFPLLLLLLGRGTG